MTTPNIPTENTPQAGALQDANPGASQTASGGASQGTQDVYRLVQDLTRRVEAAESVSRSKQSEADKVISATRKDFKAEIEPMVESAVRALGLDPQQAATYRNQLVYDEMQRRVLGASEPAPAAQPASLGSGTESATPLDELDIVKFFEMRTSDPDVAKALVDADGNTSLLKKSLAALVVKRASSPAPSTGAHAGIISGTPPEPPAENDIANITDSRQLYAMAAKSIKRRGVGVPS